MGAIKMNELNELIQFKPNTYLISNLEEIKQQAIEQASKYQNIVVANDDTYSNAKKQRTEINKMRGQVDEFRKSVRRDKLKEIEQFESDVKSVKEIYDKTWEELDNNIKEYEEQEAEKKKQRVDELLKEYSKGYEIHFLDRWLNKTTKESEIIDDIKSFAFEAETKQIRFDKAVNSIIDTCESWGLTPDGYIQLLNIGQDVLEIIERINEAGREKQKNEQIEKEIAEQKEAIKEAPKPVEIIEEHKSEELITSRIELTGTKTQFDQLNEYIKKLGIKVKPI